MTNPDPARVAEVAKGCFYTCKHSVSCKVFGQCIGRYITKGQKP
jgi:hypothetical protein